MHPLRYLLTILMLIMAIPSVFAQPGIGSITGKLTDAKNQPVSYATVTLLRADSSVANGDLTKEDGSFSISPTGLGSFRLRIETIGYTTKLVNVAVNAEHPDVKMGNIQLAATENTLKGVSIVGEKPIMELKVSMA